MRKMSSAGLLSIAMIALVAGCGKKTMKEPAPQVTPPPVVAARVRCMSWTCIRASNGG